MKKLIALFIASAITFALNAQSADKVSEIIATDKATFGHAAYLTTSALGLIKNEAGYEDAINLLKEKGIVSSSVGASDTINMQELSWICAGTWKIEGSLMLKLFNSSRYTFRQMKADEIIDFSVDPMDIPSGRNLLAVITDCLSKYEIKSGEEN